MKRSRGTLRPCRESPSEPRGTGGVPDAPNRLDSEERAEWDELAPRLARMGVLMKEQVDALELLVRAKVRFVRLAATVREMGEVLTDSRGDLVRNPNAIAMEHAQVEYRRLLGEFGLSPSSSTRVRAEADAASVDSADARRFFRLVAGASSGRPPGRKERPS